MGSGSQAVGSCLVGSCLRPGQPPSDTGVSNMRRYCGDAGRLLAGDGMCTYAAAVWSCCCATCVLSVPTIPQPSMGAAHSCRGGCISMPVQAWGQHTPPPLVCCHAPGSGLGCELPAMYGLVACAHGCQMCCGWPRGLCTKWSARISREHADGMPWAVQCMCTWVEQVLLHRLPLADHGMRSCHLPSIPC
jgi:hypothetical protein